MNDVRVPGVAWAVAIIVAIALIHENEATIYAYTGLDTFYADLAVMGLIALLKSLKLGTEQLNQALDVIELLRRRTKPTDGPQMRSAAEPAVMTDDIPERPNKVMRWLLG